MSNQLENKWKNKNALEINDIEEYIKESIDSDLDILKLAEEYTDKIEFNINCELEKRVGEYTSKTILDECFKECGKISNEQENKAIKKRVNEMVNDIIKVINNFCKEYAIIINLRIDLAKQIYKEYSERLKKECEINLSLNITNFDFIFNPVEIENINVNIENIFN